MNNKQRKTIFVGVLILTLITLTMLTKINTTAMSSQTGNTEELNSYSLYTEEYGKELAIAYEDIKIEEQIENNNEILLYGSGAKVEAQKVKKEKKSTNRWDITLSNDEIDLLAKIVWVESRGESDLGQQAVTEVIFNRMIHDDFKGSLYEVLSASGQFSSWRYRNSAEPTKKEYSNINKVLAGETEILTKEYVYFSTTPRSEKGKIPIGNHYFCK
jgi:spore germination cell wall hydrolase CwlJ-like protein